MNSFDRIRKAPSVEVKGDLFSLRGGSTGCVMILEPLSPIYNYYECIILDKGLQAAIGIGMAERKYLLNSMPGWNRNSIGYHGDNGKLYHEVGLGKRFGPTCTTGDRMGCGIDFDQDYMDGYCYVFFTKNGEQVSDSVRMKRPVHGLYPIIGLHSAGEKVQYLGHWHRQRATLSEPMIIDTSPNNQWLRSNGIHYLEDGMTLEYGGLSDNPRDPALAQAQFPLNKMNHYFELLILSLGNLGGVAIGLGKCNYELHIRPGMSRGGVGYHADTGQLFVEHGKGMNFGPYCSEGDRMGCGILFEELDQSKAEDGEETKGAENHGGLDKLEDEDEYESDDSDMSVGSLSLSDEIFDEDDYRVSVRARKYRLGNRAWDRSMPRVSEGQHTPGNPSGKDGLSIRCVVFFTKNDEMLGRTEISIPEEGLYPVVCLTSKGERVRVNLQPLSG